MTPTEAEQVREQVWTPGMRSTYQTTPGFYTHCDCQAGPTQHCTGDRHDKCHRAEPLPGYETVICGRSGEYPCTFPEPYRHLGTTGATGPQPEHHALVWLADRLCRWVCACDCHTAPDLGLRDRHGRPAPVLADALF